MDFLEKLAIKGGRLHKGGEADVSTVARMVLHDWQRGKIPFFTPPPADPKGGAKGEPTEMVQQDFKAIIVTPGFSHADLKGKAEGKGKGKAASGEGEGEGEGEEEVVRTEGGEAAQADWDELEVDGEDATSKKAAPKEAAPQEAAPQEAAPKKEKASQKAPASGPKPAKAPREPSRQAERKRVGDGTVGACLRPTVPVPLSTCCSCRALP